MRSTSAHTWHARRPPCETRRAVGEPQSLSVSPSSRFRAMRVPTRSGQRTRDQIENMPLSEPAREGSLRLAKARSATRAGAIPRRSRRELHPPGNDGQRRNDPRREHGSMGVCVGPMVRAERTRSAGPVVGQWADGARKPQLLPDRQFAFRGGVWARLPDQKTDVKRCRSDLAASRHRNEAVAHVLRLRRLSLKARCRPTRII
jgi:hypothetical protein